MSKIDWKPAFSAGIVASLLVAASLSAEAGRRESLDDQVSTSGRRVATMRSGDVRLDAEAFFASCPSILVTQETVVNGAAVVDGDCTIHVAAHRNLDLAEVDLLVGALTIQGGNDVDVNIGPDNCPDGMSCPGSDIRADSLSIRLEGDDSRGRILFSTVEADSVEVRAEGTDAEVRVHNATLDAASSIILGASGTDARTRVSVENELVDRNHLNAGEVTITSGGSDSETRVEDTVFSATGVSIAGGETRARRNDFGGASTSITGDDDCESKDNAPDLDCD